MEMVPEFCNKLSSEEIIAKINDIVKDNWISSYNYSIHNAIEFKSQMIPNQTYEDTHFKISCLYVNLLFNSLLQDIDLFEDKTILKEVSDWDENGGLCIYLSVVLYTLLIEFKVCNRNNLRLIQGFTKYTPTHPIFTLISNSATMINFHSWLSYKGSVLDFSIGQEEKNINVLKESFIIGKITEEIEYKGFKENHKTVEKYIEMYARRLNMSSSEWKLNHMQNCLKSGLKSLELLQDKINKSFNSTEHNE